jgi:hypothetical protein
MAQLLLIPHRLDHSVFELRNLTVTPRRIIVVRLDHDDILLCLAEKALWQLRYRFERNRNDDDVSVDDRIFDALRLHLPLGRLVLQRLWVARVCDANLEASRRPRSRQLAANVADANNGNHFLFRVCDVLLKTESKRKRTKNLRHCAVRQRAAVTRSSRQSWLDERYRKSSSRHRSATQQSATCWSISSCRVYRATPPDTVRRSHSSLWQRYIRFSS